MRISVFTLLLLVVLAGPVCAHRPLFVEKANNQLDNPVIIPDPDISWAVYAELTQGTVDYYEFDIPSGGQQLFAQLLVPMRPQFSNFRPTLALIGSGLPLVDSVPFDQPQGKGAIVLPWEDKKEFFEPFTQTRYYMAQEFRQNLPQGTWWLAVYNPQQGGKYTLAVGEREVWGWRDLFAFPGIWYRTRWWYNPGQTIAIIAAGLGLLGLVFWLIRSFMGRIS